MRWCVNRCSAALPLALPLSLSLVSSLFCSLACLPSLQPATASQTPSDPEDVLNDVVRIGGIGYPQRSAIVSGYALEQQWTTCTPEASHKLASAVAGEAENVCEAGDGQ
jgi:hypothetical protein